MKTAVALRHLAFEDLGLIEPWLGEEVELIAERLANRLPMLGPDIDSPTSTRNTFMKIAVFDTYVRRPDGQLMHFDILVPEREKNHGQVLQFGRRYLAAKGVPADTLRADECRYCHMESATEPVQAAIDEDGFAVIELANCD